MTAVLGAGRLEAAGAAAVDDRQLAELADRGDDRRPPLGQLLRRALLHEADRGAAQAMARGPVGDAGDLALVGHQRVEFDLRPAFDLARQRDRLLDRVDGRALRPDLDPPAERPPAGVDVDADADRRRVGAEHRLDRLQVLDAVDHHQRRPFGVAGRAQRQLAQRRRVGGRVGEQQVGVAAFGEPEGLGQRVGHQPGEARVAAEDLLDQRPAADRLGRHADRLAPGAVEQRVRVRPHRVEVDEGKRRLDRLEDPLVALVRLRGWTGHPPQPIPAIPGQYLQSGSRRPQRARAVRRGGRVAEGTRLLSE